jgi:hypothetical protein
LAETRLGQGAGSALQQACYRAALALLLALSPCSPFRTKMAVAGLPNRRLVRQLGLDAQAAAVWMAPDRPALAAQETAAAPE